MSDWMGATFRAAKAEDYDNVDWDSVDRAPAMSDLVATAEADNLVRRWTTWDDFVYLDFDASATAWTSAENLLEQYAPMVEDAVLHRANNTSMVGEARYYRHPEKARHGAQGVYKESQERDGHYAGLIALGAVSANHGIAARDPFHMQPGGHDEYALAEGTDQFAADEDENEVSPA